MFRYRAFLSYSHADSTSAKRLHGRLEGFHIDSDLVGHETPAGPIPRTLQPIFRDRHEFDAGGSLTEQTNAALDGSAALIVLASPDAARSKYVNEEVRQFKSRHPDRPVIPLILDGEPNDPNRECFPPALRFAVTAAGTITDTSVDVLAADLRERGDGMELALAKVVARLIGLPPDDIYRRADRERRRQARLKQRVQALIYVLLLGIIAGLVGWINQDYLEQEWRWFTVTRPYMVVQVRPYVLGAAAERALKPMDSFKECAKDCPRMIVVPAGSFLMGSPDGEGNDNEHPEHRVIIKKQFAVAKFDVTFADWDSCAAYGDCEPDISDSGFGRGQQPVINVTWDDARRYAAWLSKMTGKHYRLLSEAEYEYAARAGTRMQYPWGDDIGAGNSDCVGCGSAWDGKQPAPAGSFAPNRFGLYDMVGNVWQWVEDCYHPSYDGAPTEGSPWIKGGNCNDRFVRGGSWDREPATVRPAFRGWRGTTAVRFNNRGFRLARTLTP